MTAERDSASLHFALVAAYHNWRQRNPKADDAQIGQDICQFAGEVIAQQARDNTTRLRNMVAAWKMQFQLVAISKHQETKQKDLI